MTVYTYEVDHGNVTPTIHENMTLEELSGKVVMVEFGPALSNPNWIDERIERNALKARALED